MWFSPCTRVFSTNKTDRNDISNRNIVESGVIYHKPKKKPAPFGCIIPGAKNLYPILYHRDPAGVVTFNSHNKYNVIVVFFAVDIHILV